MSTRITFKNDRPATEKQVQYVTDLLNRVKKQAAEVTDRQDPKNFVRPFFAAAELPSDMTMWEASGLIDCLRDASPFIFLNTCSIAREYRKAWKRGEKKITDANKFMAVYALTESMKMLSATLTAAGK